MADAVQYAMEGMVPELEDLKHKSLMTESEVKSLVQRRSQFEYQMRRRQPLKRDFLKAIEYELNFDVLRRRRKKRLAIQGLKYRDGPSDFAAMKRISSIYQRALRNFSQDVTLWLEYFDFSMKSGSAKVLKKTFARYVLVKD